MPQTLSKCLRPSLGFSSTSAAGYRPQDKSRRLCSRKRFRERKIEKVDFVPVRSETTCVPQEEDWEQEIEEFSRMLEKEKEKELSSEMPYDPKEELKVALSEMSLYSIPHTPTQHQQHYNPSSHHTPPVRWIQHISRIEKDQFDDAEE
ncbi:hypothetical protein C0J45_0030 [Silurus meridionalis]|uniref:Uncharacterized protein n=1 Tax=Silurus meridionalis TaxID=175797 RepID=A0A8T0BVJ5_SILME|nr:hypothetical protein HF521_000049 [Silurus meridionalis]KAI5108633.1 hypothetical protein C0J45_0030 [Silurus meridionalis]